MMRSARLRFPSNINLLVKRATFRLLYFASGTSGRRTTFLRLGTICLLVFLYNPNLKDATSTVMLVSSTRKGVDFAYRVEPYNLFRTPTRECLSTGLVS